MLSSQEFAGWAKDKVLFLHVTSRVETDPHQDLLQAKGFRGFPSLAFMDATGNVIAKHSGPRDLDGLAATEAAAAEYLELTERAAKGDAAAQAELFVHNLELGHYNFRDGSQKLTKLKADLPAAMRTRAKSLLTGIEMNERVTPLRAKLRSKELTREQYVDQYGKLMLEFYRAGRVPDGAQGASVLTGVLDHARRAKDAELFAEVLEAAKKRFADNPRYRRRIEQYEKQLDELRQG